MQPDSVSTPVVSNALQIPSTSTNTPLPQPDVQTQNLKERKPLVNKGKVDAVRHVEFFQKHQIWAPKNFNTVMNGSAWMDFRKQGILPKNPGFGKKLNSDSKWANFVSFQFKDTYIYVEGTSFSGGSPDVFYLPLRYREGLIYVQYEVPLVLLPHGVCDNLFEWITGFSLADGVPSTLTSVVHINRQIPKVETGIKYGVFFTTEEITQNFLVYSASQNETDVFFISPNDDESNAYYLNPFIKLDVKTVAPIGGIDGNFFSLVPLDAYMSTKNFVSGWYRNVKSSYPVNPNVRISGVSEKKKEKEGEKVLENLTLEKEKEKDTSVDLDQNQQNQETEQDQAIKNKILQQRAKYQRRRNNNENKKDNK